jgi:chitodextrinase
MTVQWGTATVGNTSTAVTFPVAFSTACYNVQLTMVYGGSGVIQVAALVSATSTGFNAIQQNADGGFAGNRSIHWQAIGA